MTFRPSELDEATRQILVRCARGQHDLRRVTMNASGNARVRVGRNIWASILGYFDQKAEERMNFVIDRAWAPKSTGKMHKGEPVFDVAEEIRIMGMPIEYDTRLEHDEIRVCLEVQA